MSKLLNRSSWRSRLWSVAGSVSIRKKLLGVILAVTLIPGLIITVQVRAIVIRSLREQLQQHSQAVAHDVGAQCADLVACNDIEALRAELQDAWLYNQDMRYIMILDAEQRILASSFDQGAEQTFAFMFSDPAALDLDGAHFAGENESERIWETTVPILDGMGFVRVGLGEQRMWDVVNKLTGRILLIFAIVSLLGMIAAIAVTLLLTRPVLDLREATERVGRGDYAVSVRRWANDEVGDLADAFNAMLARLERAEAARNQREQMRQFYLQRIMHAQEEERRRLARELHDETGQALASLMVGLKNVEDAPDEALMRERVGALRQVVATTLQDVRRMAQDLRPLALDDLGLTTALLLYADDFQERFHVNVNIQVVNLEAYTLTPALETTVYRVVQEALLNAARHGQCTDISVLLQVHEDMLSVIVEDNGCGFDLKQVVGDDFGRTRLGLYGMRERAELVGGALELETAPGRGCTIYLRAPLPGPGAGLAAT